MLEQANQHQKADADLWLARAERLARKGQVEPALTVLEQAMAPEAAGDRAALRIARARLLTLRGRGQEAREQLVRDLDHLPPDQRPDVWKALGDLYNAQHNSDEARRAYEQWADARPDDPLPLLFLLEVALAENDREAADHDIARLKQKSGARASTGRSPASRSCSRRRPASRTRPPRTGSMRPSRSSTRS